jgi:hypothetical protein
MHRKEVGKETFKYKSPSLHLAYFTSLPKTLLTASRYPNPFFLSVSRQLPSAHSFRALMVFTFCWNEMTPLVICHDLKRKTFKVRIHVAMGSP